MLNTDIYPVNRPEKEMNSVMPLPARYDKLYSSTCLKTQIDADESVQRNGEELIEFMKRVAG